MKFFLDTAITDELRQGAATGLVDGVTTNPTLIARSGKKLEDVVQEIVDIIDGPISVETLSSDVQGTIDEGRQYAKIHKNIVVKCPLTEAGLSATKVLSAEGIKVNVTLCFSAMQALLAAKAGAAYISPFVGRLDDTAHDGMQLVEDIVQIYNTYDFKTEVLAASLRHPIHVYQSALAGAHVGTLPFKVFKQLFKHPLTDSGLAQFMKDWEASQEK